ncbi:MAG TPA: hypothetical protein VLC54_19715 [Anaeromyxobacter sp.]|nr:hypothetical protein [Anaeromyxobacter sp.]
MRGLPPFTPLVPDARVRAVNIALGLWLFASTFLLDRAGNAGFNTLLVGLFVAAIALIALYAPGLRFLNTGLAAWLLVSTIWFGYSKAWVAFHDAAVAGAMVVVSLVRTPALMLRRRESVP